MLVHIPADRSRIYSISPMRDLWINIPDHGEAKINAALAYGGVPLVVQTVESLLQQRIDQVVSIDFVGFKALRRRPGRGQGGRQGAVHRRRGPPAATSSRRV